MGCQQLPAHCSSLCLGSEQPSGWLISSACVQVEHVAAQPGSSASAPQAAAASAPTGQQAPAGPSSKDQQPLGSGAAQRTPLHAATPLEPAVPVGASPAVLSAVLRAPAPSAEMQPRPCTSLCTSECISRHCSSPGGLACSHRLCPGCRHRQARPPRRPPSPAQMPCGCRRPAHTPPAQPTRVAGCQIAELQLWLGWIGSGARRGSPQLPAGRAMQTAHQSLPRAGAQQWPQRLSRIPGSLQHPWASSLRRPPLPTACAACTPTWACGALPATR